MRNLKQYAIYDRSENLVAVGNAKELSKLLNVKQNNIYLKAFLDKNRTIKPNTKYKVVEVESEDEG